MDKQEYIKFLQSHSELMKLRCKRDYRTRFHPAVMALRAVEDFKSSMTPLEPFFFPWSRKKEEARFANQQAELERLEDLFSNEIELLIAQDVKRAEEADNKTPF